MFKHVVVAIDFSPAWRQLRNRLVSLHAWVTRELTQIHVLKGPMSGCARAIGSLSSTTRAHHR